jgi:hypothetical protein
MFTMCPQRGHDAALRARGYIGGCPPGLSRPVAGLRTAGLSTAGPPCCNCAGERNLARASDISCLPPPSLGRARASTKPASQRGPCRMRLRTPFAICPARQGQESRRSFGCPVSFPSPHSRSLLSAGGCACAATGIEGGGFAVTEPPVEGELTLRSNNGGNTSLSCFTGHITCASPCVSTTKHAVLRRAESPRPSLPRITPRNAT